MRIQSFSRIWPLVVAFVLLAAVLTFAIEQMALSDASKERASTDSCRQFVQQFYNWYVHAAKPKGNMSTVEFALKQRTSSFTAVLKQELEEDEQASAKNAGEVVGLDFDPFLASQDDPERLVVGKATMKLGNCFVEVFRTFRGAKKSNKADVTPELAYKDGHWVFVNFHYPASGNASDDDLLSALKQLAADRAKHP